MKIFQKGFTIAELLLVIAIIGIVSAMGASITKKTTQKAYDLYYYTGFVNLYDALADTEMNTGNTETNKVGGGNCSIDISAPICHVNNLLGTTSYNGGTPFTIISKNGITYEFQENKDWSLISMGVPQPKTRMNPDGRVYVALKFNTNSYGRQRREYLVPVDPTYLQNLPAGRQYIHIGNRRDLLPTYSDDGLVGRVRQNINAVGTAYNNIQYYTFDQTACSYIKNNYTTAPILGGIDGNHTILNCDTVQNIPAYNNGILKFADPRKAK